MPLCTSVHDILLLSCLDSLLNNIAAVWEGCCCVCDDGGVHCVGATSGRGASGLIHLPASVLPQDIKGRQATRSHWFVPFSIILSIFVRYIEQFFI